VAKINFSSIQYNFIQFQTKTFLPIFCSSRFHPSTLLLCFCSCPSGKLNNKNIFFFSCFIADKNNSWLRFRYGRLSVDSDDQNFNKKCDIDIVDDDDDDVLVEYKVGTKCCDKINSIAGSQCLDANGNQVNESNQNDNNDNAKCDCVGVKIESQMKSSLSETNSIHQIDKNTVKNLQTIALSDYGKLSSFFFILIFTFRLNFRCRCTKKVHNILPIKRSRFIFRIQVLNFLCFECVT
jgi:hypothetical protein